MKLEISMGKMGMPAWGVNNFSLSPLGVKKLRVFFHTVYLFCVNKNSITYFHHSHFRYISTGNQPLPGDRPEATPSPRGATAARCKPETQTLTQIPLPEQDPASHRNTRPPAHKSAPTPDV